jgi:hypothetical protein
MGDKVKGVMARTFERAAWASLVVALLGGLLIVWASSKHGTAATVLINLGSSLMTIGLIGVLYDLLLRRLLVSEVLEAVGVHESARSVAEFLVLSVNGGCDEGWIGRGYVASTDVRPYF